MRYAVESLMNGTTRRVPSFVLVVESEVQPCQVRKAEHWFLIDYERALATEKVFLTLNHKGPDSRLASGLRHRGRVASMNRLLRIYGHSRPYILGPPNVLHLPRQCAVRGSKRHDLVPESSVCRNKKWAE